MAVFALFKRGGVIHSVPHYKALCDRIVSSWFAVFALITRDVIHSIPNFKALCGGIRRCSRFSRRNRCSSRCISVVDVVGLVVLSVFVMVLASIGSIISSMVGSGVQNCLKYSHASGIVGVVGVVGVVGLSGFKWQCLPCLQEVV